MEDELRQVLSYYDLGEPRSIQRVECGFVNDNWVLETTRGQYFLKRRHTDLRNPEVICFQHDLMQHLRQAEFPAPAILPTISGETFLVHAGEFYEIQEYINGAPCEHFSPPHIHVAALMLGHYHACVRDFVPRPLCDFGDLYSPAILINNLTRLSEAWALHRDPTLRQIVHQLETQAEELAALFTEHGELPHLVIHGDYHAGNLLFQGDRIIGVVDYDKSCYQPRVVELAEALIYFASTRPGHLKHLVYLGFLEWGTFMTFMYHYGCGLSSFAKEPVQYDHRPEADRPSDLACQAGDVFLKANEVYALPDYIRCIWLSVSLQRLLEKTSRSPVALEALREVLALGQWAATNRERIIHSALEKISDVAER